MIEGQIREARYFFYSQAFADGLRASFAIILPALLGSYFGFFEIGLKISLGAMVVSLTDAPGPPLHKRNGMLIAAGLAFITAIITGFAATQVYLMALTIVLVTFFFSMFTVYGARASSVGNAAMLIMILTMDAPVGTSNILLQAVYILAGGLFYFSLSMLLYFLRPYRHAQRALGDCVREVASYLRLRAAFYDTATPIDANYRKLIAQQIIVNEKQDAARELFFKTRQIVEESTEEGRRLVFTFVETIDLFEDITASYYDYERLRQQFGDSGALELIHHSLLRVASELDRIGIAIQTNTSYTAAMDFDSEVKNLKANIDALVQPEDNRMVLRKIIVNIRNLLSDINNIIPYFERNIRRKKSEVDHTHFISHQSLDASIFRNNLSLQSAVFRHAVRVSLACLTGFALSRIVAYGEHSYWILLTIAFILKPAFSLTKQRNIERIIGTLAGGLIGILILLFIPDTTIRFILMVVLMIGTYSFMRVNYLLMVICTTPYVLILFSFFGYMFRDVVRERVLDTLIGCAIAFSASYFLFPKWESEGLRSFMQGLLRANGGYLNNILEALSGKRPDMLKYKLARKEVYLNTANLSAAFQRMLSEPKNKQSGAVQVHQFVVLNHILFSNMATVATTLLAREPRNYSEGLKWWARKALLRMERSTERFETKVDLPAMIKEKDPGQDPSSEDDLFMKDQLQFIYTVSQDIDKTVKLILEENTAKPVDNP